MKDETLEVILGAAGVGIGSYLSSQLPDSGNYVLDFYRMCSLYVLCLMPAIIYCEGVRPSLESDLD